MRVQSLGQEEPLEKEMATCSSILAWEISWTEEPGGLQSMGSQKNGTQLYNGTTTAKPAQTMKPQLIQPLELESLPD